MKGLEWFRHTLKPVMGSAWTWVRIPHQQLISIIMDVMIKMCKLSLKAFDVLKQYNLIKYIISFDGPIILTITKEVPQFRCLKIYDDKLDLEFEYGTFTFDLVDYDEYSVEDIIESVDRFFDMRISRSYC